MIMDRNNGLITEEILLTIEQYLGFRFPKDYQKFILEYNGGEPKLKFFSYKDDESDGSLVDYFFGFVPNYDKNILLFWRDYKERIPSNTFPIARDPGGNLIIMSVKGPDRNKIYFWDHDWEAEEGQTPDYSNLTLIADNFTDFINSLTSEAELI